MRKNKREAMAVILVIVCFLSVYGIVALYKISLRNKYEEGYTAGYEAGRLDTYVSTRAEAEGSIEAYEYGFEAGSEEVYDKFIYAIESAYEYARDNSEWSVYDAWCNVGIYREGVHPYGLPLPTEEEYMQSVYTLELFCEYLDSINFYDMK